MAFGGLTVSFGFVGAVVFGSGFASLPRADRRTNIGPSGWDRAFALAIRTAAFIALSRAAFLGRGTCFRFAIRPLHAP